MGGKQIKPDDVSEWTCTIGPVSGWFNVDVGELWQYRDLILLFVKRDFVAIYKQTILGPLWYLIQPLMTTLVFAMIFNQIAKLSTDGMPALLFYLSGIVVWRYFADCLQKTANTFVGNASLFGKVYFPRLVVPISVIISNLISFSIQLALFACFWLYYKYQGVGIQLNAAVFLMPFLVLHMATLGLGCGIIISSLTTKYRDLAQLVGFGVQLWMFLTPIVYPTSIIPDKWKWCIVLNPMTPVVESFRFIFLGVGAVNGWSLLMSALAAAVILFIGVMLFSRIEKNFMDTV